MTTETITMLNCNARGCRATVTVEGDEEAAWREADAKGWSYDTDGHDWCPWHVDPDRRIQQDQPDQQEIPA